MAEARQFRPPGYKSRLEALMDLIRFGPGTLGQGRFAVLLFLAERTICWNKSTDAASLGQMADGVRVKRGKWIRGGSGLSRRAAARATTELVRMGLLMRERQESTKRGNEPSEYTVKWAALKRFFRASINKGSQHPLVPVVHKALVPVVHKPCATQAHTRVEVHHQFFQEHNASAQRNAPGIVGAPSEKAETAKDLSDADDEKSKSPETQFLGRLAERHGAGFDGRGALRSVKAQLERANAQLEDFLKLDAERTTNPSVLSNPSGHYVTLAKAVCRATREAALAQSLVVHSAKVIDNGRCGLCMAGRLDGGGYCGCTTGRDLAKVEKRLAKERAASAAQEAAAP